MALGSYLERSVRIWVDADKLDAKGLAVSDLIAALRREHVELPAGPFETSGREVNVRVLGGMVVATMLSLLVVPAFYMLMDGWLGVFRRTKGPVAIESIPDADSDLQDSNVT